MTSDRIIICLIAMLALISCHKNDNEDTHLGDRGYYLTYVNGGATHINAVQNAYAQNTIDTTCADLLIYVFGDQENDGHFTGDKAIEEQLDQFFEPLKHEYNGTYPIHVEYRTEVCKSIKIELYDKEGNYVSDITSKAHFYTVFGQHYVEEAGANLLINSQKKFLGKIPIGTTIQQYLSYEPMIFSYAHFIFDDIDKSIFDNGYYVQTEIKLSNGKILKAKSTKDH